MCAAAALPSADVAVLDGQIATALARWHATGAYTPQTLLRSTETVHRFARRLTAQGVDDVRQVTPAHCRGFLDAATGRGRPPEDATRHHRRVALRMLFRALREAEITQLDPTLDLLLPARTSSGTRPLTDEEIGLCRAATRLGLAGSGSLQRAVTWALAETGAITSEISTLKLSDLDDPHAPRWVALPGTRRTDARLGELSEWGRRVVTRYAEDLLAQHLPSRTPLAYRGNGTPGEHIAQAAVCSALAGVLSSTGLAQERDVRPASIRNWAGRRLYDAGMPVEQVAKRLGVRSLDTCAQDIGLHWRAQP